MTLEAASRPALSTLEKLGYCYFPYRAAVMHWLCKPSPQFRTHHLSLVPFQSRLWIERLAFRDYLRAHADVAAEYATLKRELALRYRFDREAYTDGKRTIHQSNRRPGFVRGRLSSDPIIRNALRWNVRAHELTS